MFDFIMLIIVVPLVIFIGITFLATAVLIIYRDVLEIDDEVSKWLGDTFMSYRVFGSKKDSGLLVRLANLGLAVVAAYFGYMFLRYGVVELIARYIFGV